MSQSSVSWNRVKICLVMSNHGSTKVSFYFRIQKTQLKILNRVFIYYERKPFNFVVSIRHYVGNVFFIKTQRLMQTKFLLNLISLYDSQISWLPMERSRDRTLGRNLSTRFMYLKAMSVTLGPIGAMLAANGRNRFKKQYVRDGKNYSQVIFQLRQLTHRAKYYNKMIKSI